MIFLAGSVCGIYSHRHTFPSIRTCITHSPATKKYSATSHGSLSSKVATPMTKPFVQKSLPKLTPHQPTAPHPGGAKMTICTTCISGMPTYLPVTIVTPTDTISPIAPSKPQNAYIPQPLPPA